MSVINKIMLILFNLKKYRKFTFLMFERKRFYRKQIQL